MDYCQYGDSGLRKLTRFFGSNHLTQLSPVLCDGVNCANLGVGRRHLRPLGGHWAATKARIYPIPAPIVEIASGLRSQEGKDQGKKWVPKRKLRGRPFRGPSDNHPTTLNGVKKIIHGTQLWAVGPKLMYRLKWQTAADRCQPPQLAQLMSRDLRLPSGRPGSRNRSGNPRAGRGTRSSTLQPNRRGRRSYIFL